MKKIMLCLVAVAIATTGFSQKEKKNITPNAAIKTAFEKNFKGAEKVKWEKEKDGGYEAGFKQNGKDMSATYAADGTLKETEWKIEVSELPAAVLNYVSKNYKGKKITEAAKILKAGGEINYEAEVNGKDVIFDVNGKFIKETQD